MIRIQNQLERLRRCIVLASLFVMVPTLVAAQTPLTGAFAVNTYTTDDQQRQAVGIDADGNSVVVWQSRNQDGDGTGIFGQRFDVAGGAVGVEFQVNSYTTSTQAIAAVAVADDGAFSVAWHSLGPDGDGTGVAGQVFSSDGAMVGSEFQVNTYTTGNQYFVAADGDAAGNFVVVWESVGQDGGSSGVFGQLFDSLGASVGAEFPVNSFTTGAQKRPSVSMNDTGDFVVVWESSGQDGSSYGVFGQRFDSAGVQVGAEFQANSYITGSQHEPAVTVGPSGAFAVAWERSTGPIFADDVYVKLYDDGGNVVGSEFFVNSFTTGQQDNPAIAMDASGNLIVMWESFGQDAGGSEGGVYGQLLDAAGGAIGAEFRANQYQPDSQDNPEVEITDGGIFVVTWESRYQDGGDEGIYARVYEGPTTTTTSTTTTTLPPLCATAAASGCRGAAAGKTKFQIKLGGTSASDKMSWKFKRGDATLVTDFGDPVAGSPEYAFCVYDTGAGSQPIHQVDIPAGGTCGSSPCWASSGSSGFSYRDSVGSIGGVTQIKLRAGTAGKSQIQLKAKGADVMPPSLPLAAGAVSVQFVADNGTTTECWQVVYASVAKNTATQVKAKGP